MKHLKSKFAIVSAYKKDLSANVNMTRHLEAIAFLKSTRTPHKEVYGYYDGEGERSILIAGDGCTVVAQHLATEYEQECYLYANQDRQAELRGDGWTKPIGTFKAVSKEDAMLSDGFTVDPATGIYYICD